MSKQANGVLARVGMESLLKKSRNGMRED
uniref:Uncharacterized protein n=1 Tax=Arundo donax TaxID=35708 RepID=A0A0A9FL38_ARUDO